MPLAAAPSHWLAPHLLLQKFPAPEFSAATALRFAPATEGDTAGLMVFGYDYAWLGLRQTAGGLRLVLTTCEKAQENGAEREVASADLPPTTGSVQLRVEVGAGALCRFAWSLDGASFTPMGPAFKATVSRWVGAKVGLFASAAPGTAAAPGYADFDWFRVE